MSEQETQSTPPAESNGASQSDATEAVPSHEAERRIVADLERKFPALAGKAFIQRDRRIWLEVPLEQFRDIFAHAHQALGFGMLCTITGTDEGAELGLIYHLATDQGVMLNLTVLTPKDGPGPKTVIEFFPGAELYEREVIDLLGVQIQNMPEGNRYPLPEDWPPNQYPLRKDWSAEQEGGTDQGAPA
jgi:membrane-bound hydrogenase subunit beta